MVLLQGRALNLPFACPPFRLPSVDDKIYELADFADAKGLLVAFICNHCPYVKAIEQRLIDLAKLYSEKGIKTVGICSNDAANYPDDSKAELFKRWREKDYGFPYLIDENQSVAKAFDAVCTPDLFLFDQKGKLFYHGRLDDATRDNPRVKQHDLRNAIDALLANKEAPKEQIPCMGCSIKWR